MSRPVIEKIAPRDRDAWLRIRGRDVTASVVGALFGVHPWVSLFDLWATKTGRKPREDNDANAAIERGVLLEEVAVKVLRKRFPAWQIEHNAGGVGTYFRAPELRLGATPDVIVKAPGRGLGVVQIKSVEASIFRKRWFEDGEFEPPLWVALQATLEAYLTGASWASVAALVVGHGVDLHIVEVPLVDGVVEAMAAKTAEFFQMIEQGREPTPDFNRDGPVIEAMYGDGAPEAEVDLSSDNRIPVLLAERQAATAALRDAKAALEAIDAEVKSKIGAATVAHIGGGRRIVWKLQHREGGFVPASTFRALRYPTERN